MEWHARLLQRIKDLGWPKVELARRAGLDKDRLYKWLRGGVDHPRGDVLERLAKAVGWTEHFLLYGVELDQSDDRLPFYSWGELKMLDVVRRNSAEAVGMLKPNNDVGPDAFYTTAPDNSNAPGIMTGDRLLCDPAKPAAPGVFVIAKVVGHADPILARYKVKKTKGGKPIAVDLVPDNDKFETVEVRRMADMQILGRVVYRTHPI
jgi:transcriptional regulator with XRE-family HTH domain